MTKILGSVLVQRSLAAVVAANAAQGSEALISAHGGTPSSRIPALGVGVPCSSSGDSPRWESPAGDGDAL